MKILKQTMAFALSFTLMFLMGCLVHSIFFELDWFASPSMATDDFKVMYSAFIACWFCVVDLVSVPNGKSSPSYEIAYATVFGAWPWSRQ